MHRQTLKVELAHSDVIRIERVVKPGAEEEGAVSDQVVGEYADRLGQGASDEPAVRARSRIVRRDGATASDRDRIVGGRGVGDECVSDLAVVGRNTGNTAGTKSRCAGDGRDSDIDINRILVV